MSVSHYTTKVLSNSTIQSYMPGNTLAYNAFKYFPETIKKYNKACFHTGVFRMSLLSITLPAQ